MPSRTARQTEEIIEADIGARLRVLRERRGLSIRKLAGLAGVTAGMISFVERGKTSPSIVTVTKLLSALGTDMPSFFGADPETQEGPVFRREKMRLVSDADRNYTIVFPKTPDARVEMIDETMAFSKRKPPFERLNCDICGYVLSGSLVLEIKGKKKSLLRLGDAFYVPEGTPHRGYAGGPDPARLITVMAPPEY